MSTGTGRTKSVSSRPVTAIVRSSQFSEPRVSSSAVASTPPWARPGAPWWAGLTVNSAVTLTPSPARAWSCRPDGCPSPQPETVLVVRTEELPGGGSVRVPDRRDRVDRGCQSGGCSTHRRRPYPRGGVPVAPCQAWLHAAFRTALRRTCHRSTFVVVHRLRGRCRLCAVASASRVPAAARRAERRDGRACGSVEQVLLRPDPGRRRGAGGGRCPHPALGAPGARRAGPRENARLAHAKPRTRALSRGCAVMWARRCGWRTRIRTTRHRTTPPPGNRGAWRRR
ncbi:hypothetical protein SMICM304S_07927 [Streptomyces microflavus]